MERPTITPEADKTQLKRTVTLLPLTLYGIGVIVGAGIYVLIGETAARAGFYTPLSYLMASMLVALTAASYAELSTSFPVSAAETAYIRAGLRIEALATLAGLLVCASGIISSATLVQGGAGYASSLTGLPPLALAVFFALFLGTIVGLGIELSVGVIATITVIEVGGLLLIAVLGLGNIDAVQAGVAAHYTPFDMSMAVGVISGVLLAFFAFIGFEDMVNISEEVKEPERTMPKAIAMALICVTIVYMAIASVAVIYVDTAELAASKAPLSLVFERVTSLSGAPISMVAIFAALGGVIAQIVMSTRILYGLGRMGKLPGWFGVVHPRTQTPVNATVLVTAIIVLLAMTLPTRQLAETTAAGTLFAFSFVNLSLWRMKGRPDYRSGGFTIPRIVPLLGAVLSMSFLLNELIRRIL
ncbi:APC family permease [Dichotomicrobium thermohalophilum]|uniref:Amino acid/polyamine/organocation transporter (APC superfamily) n=1 Tax=Dichotomicrobium thermohalophilum TaxID=933063 RepID=A0A397Q568_9HYPH|nr:amino acid permease [Dichotomicrobium thermohalophilum]RIA56456.1 amino acid/polyamine/organocation transporter (APC superfamily) [Dichotomicrobium thermohalophilum]